MGENGGRGCGRYVEYVERCAADGGTTFCAGPGPGASAAPAPASTGLA